jgi:hypothetical protein
METRSGSSVETREGSSMETRSGSSVETREGSSMETTAKVVGRLMANTQDQSITFSLRSIGQRQRDL